MAARDLSKQKDGTGHTLTVAHPDGRASRLLVGSGRRPRVVRGSSPGIRPQWGIAR